MEERTLELPAIVSAATNAPKTTFGSATSARTLLLRSLTLMVKVLYGRTLRDKIIRHALSGSVSAFG